MMNKKRTRNLMKSKYVMFLPMAILLMSFTGIRNQSTFVVPFLTEEITETAQATEIPQTPAEDEEILHVVDEMPHYPGGVKELMKYISENLRYPREAADAAVQGRVIVQMVVRKDGSIDDVRVARGVHEALDQEAVRVIKSMTTWQPGKHEGKVRNVYYTIPVEFRL